MPKSRVRKNKRPPYVCDPCKTRDCNNCTDIMRVVFDQQLICKCDRRGHDGEPRDKQVKDPFTGEVHVS